MCGIAGFIDRLEFQGAEKRIGEMLRPLESRGPDGQGTWLERFHDYNVALGHRRLSIIDLEGGTQPLANSDNQIWTTFNGEIFNYLELKEKLLASGYKFKTKSDTEVLVHLFEELGADGFQHLNGMFAYSIWDHRKQELWLVRDRAGIKPLYYSVLPEGGILFGSELSSLWAHPSCPRYVDPQAVSSFLFSDSIHAPRTILQGVQKLPPGHYLKWNMSGRIEVAPYWQLNLPLRRSFKLTKDLFSEKVSDLEVLLIDSVKRQLISDVPVGAFLSGGIDSSLVTAIANKLSPGNIQTFSIGFEDTDFDESPYSDLLSQKLKTEHRKKIISEKNLLEIVPRVLSRLDEPLGDPSILPTTLLSELAAEHVKVVIGGDGGDELFAGYPTYWAHGQAKYFEALPAAVRHKWIAQLVSQLKVKPHYQSLEWKLKRFVLRWDDSIVRRHFRWMSATDLPDLQRFFTQLKEEPDVLQAFSEHPDVDSLTQLLALDFQTYLPDNVLTKVDRASMAHSLEVRPPLLDNHIIDFAFNLPSQFKLKKRTSKYILKKLALRWIPAEIVNRKKRGFAIPLSRWIAGPLQPMLAKILHESPLWDLDLVNHKVAVTWNEEHLSHKVDRSKSLWGIIVLDHWLRKFPAQRMR